MSGHGLKHGQKVEIRSFTNPYFKVDAIFCSWERRKGEKVPPEFEHIPKEDCFVYRTKEGFKFASLSKFYVYEAPTK